MHLGAYEHRRSHKRRARTLRHHSSKPERIFWAQVRQKNWRGYKIRRQVPIGPFIVDFLCHEAKTIIEIDGPYHEFTRAYDLARELYLERRGFHIIRFSNDDIVEDCERALRKLQDALTSPHPIPLPEGEGTF